MAEPEVMAERVELQGVLLKLGWQSGKWQSRYFELTSDGRLSYARSAGGRALDVVQLSDSSRCRFAPTGGEVQPDALAPGVDLVKPVPSHALSVTVTRTVPSRSRAGHSYSRTYYLAAANVQEQQAWIAALSETIRQIQSLPPALYVPTSAVIASEDTDSLADDTTTKSFTGSVFNQTSKAGALLKLGFDSGKWQRRFFELQTDGTISYSASTERASQKTFVLGRGAYCEAVEAGAELADDAMSAGVRATAEVPKYTLRVVAHTVKGVVRSYYLAADGKALQESWLAAIRAVIQDETRPLLCERFRWRPNTAVGACLSCGQPFNLFVRRHHCRVCGEIFCAACSDRLVAGQRACRACNDKYRTCARGKYGGSTTSLVFTGLGVTGQASTPALPVILKTSAPKLLEPLTAAQIIAIVGLHCRVPKVGSAAEFWGLLARRELLAKSIPRDRWDTQSYSNSSMDRGASKTSVASLFSMLDVQAFDSAYFGVNPDEANRMDPQQRLSLMAVKDALDNAGIDLAALPAGSKVAVYVGIMNFDYGLMQTREPQDMSSHSAAGSAFSICANRISFHFNLHGESMSIDTACSSSMVAVHLGRQALLTGTADLAVCVGVNTCVAPENFVALSSAGMLSPQGVSKSYSQEANGYGRGEAVGVVILRRLPEAELLHDRIYARILATRVNHDGYTAKPITKPSQIMQQELFELTCADARIRPVDVTYVEDHVTGTQVGDRANVASTGFVYGGQDRALRVGVLKPNISHTEAASGIMALIKCCLMLYNREWLPSVLVGKLHFDDVFRTHNMELQAEHELFPDDADPIIAINAFGFGGTNSHAIIKGYKPPPLLRAERELENDQSVQIPLLLSAESAAALTQFLQSMLMYLDEQDADSTVSSGMRDSLSQINQDKSWLALCAAMAKRQLCTYRFCIMATSTVEARAVLSQLLATRNQALSKDQMAQTPWAEVKLIPDNDRPFRQRLVMVFSGQGQQHRDMLALMRSHPIFGLWVNRILDYFAAVSGGRRLLEELDRIDATEVCQPAIFTCQVALYETLRAHGIQPEAIVGHSVGEVAAAYAAGVFDLKDAVTLIYHRSRLQAITDAGAMVQIAATPDQVTSLLYGLHDVLVDIACYNSPKHVVVAGEDSAVSIAIRRAKQQGFGVTLVANIKHPFHTRAMDKIKQAFYDCDAAKLVPRLPTIPFFSTVTGSRATGLLDASYWFDNMRCPVRFDAAVRALLAAGYNSFYEVSGHPILQYYLKEGFKPTVASHQVIATLRRPPKTTTHPDDISLAALEQLRNSLACRWNSGGEIELRSWFEGKILENGLQAEQSMFMDSLPHYPWQLRSHWSESSSLQVDRTGQWRQWQPHPLVSSAVRRLRAGELSFEANLADGSLSFIQGHVVEKKPVVPAAIFVEMALAAAAKACGNANVDLQISFEKILPYSSDALRLIIRLTEQSDPCVAGRRLHFRIVASGMINSAAPAEVIETQHASGVITCAGAPPPYAVGMPAVTLQSLHAQATQQLSVPGFYQNMAARGFLYKDLFRCITDLRQQPGDSTSGWGLVQDLEVAAEYSLPWLLHPACMDGAFQTALAVLQTDPDGLYLPSGIGRLRWFAAGHGVSPRFPLYVRVTEAAGLTDRSGTSTEVEVAADLHLYDQAGHLIMQIEDLRARNVNAQDWKWQADDLLYDLRYEPWSLEQTTGLSIDVDRNKSADAPVILVALCSQEALTNAIVLLMKLPTYVVLLDKEAQASLQDQLQQKLRTMCKGLSADNVWSLLPLTLAEPSADLEPSECLAHARLLCCDLLISMGDILAAEGRVPRITVYTMLAENAGPQQKAFNTFQALSWGFIRTLRMEQPKMHIVSVDLDSASPPDIVLGLQAQRASPDLLEFCVRESMVLERKMFRHIAGRDGSTAEPLRFMVRHQHFTLMATTPAARASTHPPSVPAATKEVTHSSIALTIDSAALLPQAMAGQPLLGTAMIGRGITQPDQQFLCCGVWPLQSSVVVPAKMVLPVPATVSSELALLLLLAEGCRQVLNLQADDSVAVFAPSTTAAIALSTVLKAAVPGLDSVHGMGLDELDTGLFSPKDIVIYCPSTTSLLDDRLLQHCCRPGGTWLTLWPAASGSSVPVSLPVQLFRASARPARILAAGAELFSLARANVLAEILSRLDLSHWSLQTPMSPKTRLKIFSEACLRPQELHSLYVLEGLAQEEPFAATLEGGIDLSCASQQPKEMMVLIIGGTGGLGAHLAEWLAAGGVRHFCLASRSGRWQDESVEARLQTATGGGTVMVVKCDVTCRSAVELLVTQLVAEGQASGTWELQGVIHAAMAGQAKLIEQSSAADFHQVADPKAVGCWLVHQAVYEHMESRGRPLKFFVVLSSLLASFGGAGQSAYAGANLVMDRLVDVRRQQGLHAVALNVGPVGQAGTLRTDKAAMARFIRMGMLPVPLEALRQTLGYLLRTDEAHILVAIIQFQSLLQIPDYQFLLQTMQPVTGPLKLSVNKKGPSATQDDLRALVARAIGLEEEAVDVDVPLGNLGLDSSGRNYLSNSIQEHYKVSLPSTDILSKSTNQLKASIALLQDPSSSQASFLEAALDERPGQLQLQPDLDNIFEPFPLSDIQQSYFVGRSTAFALGETGCHFYVEYDLFYDEEMCKLAVAALQRIMTRHFVFRLRLNAKGEQFFLSETPELRLEEGRNSKNYRQTTMSVAQIEAEEERRRQGMSHEILNPASDPCIRFFFALLPAGFGGHTSDFVRLHLSVDMFFLDAGSIFMFFQEYLTLISNKADVLPSPPMLSFRDYVLYCEQMRSTQQYAMASQFWARMIENGNVPPGPELPLIQNPALVVRGRFERLRTVLSAEENESISRLARQASVSKETVLLACLAQTLGIFSSRPVFSINMTTSYRQGQHLNPEVVDIMGEFTSSVPVACDVSADENLLQLLQRIQQSLGDSLNHQMVSGVEISRMISRKTGETALFPVVLTCATSKDMGSVESELGAPVFAVSQTPQVWMDFQIFTNDGALNLSVDYVTQLFHPDTANAIFYGYVDLLHTIARDEGLWGPTSTNRLPTTTIGPEMFGLILPEDVPQRKWRLLQDGFLASAVAHPESVAMVDSASTEWSYAQVLELHWQVARSLPAPHGPEDRHAALCLPKGPWQIIAALGILACGRAFIPLFEGVDWVRDILQQHSVHVLVSTSAVPEYAALIDTIRESCPDVLVVDVMQLDSTPPGEEPVFPSVDPEDDAYVLFTSGTTSKPKGVRMSHRAALNTVEEICSLVQLTSSDRVLALSNLYFDLSIFDIFGTFSVGACLCVPASNTVSQAREWVSFACSQRVTIWNSVPQLLRTALSLWGPERYRSLRSCLVSGDKVPVDLPNKVWTATNARLIALGGATEAGIWSNSYEVQPSVDYTAFGRVPYGHALWGQTMYVLDCQLRPCPMSVVGTIFIGGGSLATGYWHDDERTNRTFLTHPTTGERLYNTGDLGRYIDAEHTIDIMGRVAQMETSGWIKVRGVRLNPDMIVSALLSNADVVNASVCSMAVHKNHEELVAVLVPDKQRPCSSDAGQTVLLPLEETFVYQTLRNRFPQNMLPTWVLFVQAIPLTANGKVNYSLLTECVQLAFSNAQSRSGAVAAPSTAMELSMCNILREHLQLPGNMVLDVNERYSNWGLNSMTGIYLVEKLRLSGIEVYIDQVLQLGTVRALSRVARWTTAVDPAHGYRVPLTVFQEKYGLFGAHQTIVLKRIVNGEALITAALAKFSLLRAQWIFEAGEIHVEVPPHDKFEREHREHGPLVQFQYDVHRQTLSISASTAILDAPSWTVLLDFLDDLQHRPPAKGVPLADEYSDDWSLDTEVLWPCWLEQQQQQQQQQQEKGTVLSVSVKPHQRPPLPAAEPVATSAMRCHEFEFALDVVQLAAEGSYGPMDVVWRQVRAALPESVSCIRATFDQRELLQASPWLGPRVSILADGNDHDGKAAVLVTVVQTPVRHEELYSLLQVMPSCFVEVLVVPATDKTNEALYSVWMRAICRWLDDGTAAEKAQELCSALELQLVEQSRPPPRLAAPIEQSLMGVPTPIQVMMLRHGSADVYMPQATFVFADSAGTVDLPRMEWAWQCVYAKCPALRSVYEHDQVQDSWRAAVRMAVPSQAVRIHKVSSLQRDGKAVLRFLQEERRLVAQPHAFPLFRVAVLHNQANPSELSGEVLAVITYHHAIMDGLSMPTVMDIFREEYRSIGRGAPASPLLMQMPFSLPLSRATDPMRPVQSAELEFEAVHVMRGPAERPVWLPLRGPSTGKRDEMWLHPLPMADFNKTLPLFPGLQQAQILYALWAMTLGIMRKMSLKGTTEDWQIPMGIIASYRQGREFAQVTNSLNVLPVLVDCARDMPLGDWLTAFGQQIQSIALHQAHVPLETVAANVGTLPGKLFDTAVNVINIPRRQNESIDGLTSSDFVVHDHWHFPVVVHIIVPHQHVAMDTLELNTRLAFDPSLVDKTYVRRSIRVFEELWKALALLSPDSKAGSLGSFMREATASLRR